MKIFIGIDKTLYPDILASVIIYIFKLLFISCKERSNKWLDDAVTIYFHVSAPQHGTLQRDVAKKKFLVFNSFVFKNN